MNADEMRKKKEKRKSQAFYQEGLDSILKVIEEMADDGMEYLLTPPVFEVEEAQHICGDLISRGFKVRAIQNDNEISIEVDWS